MTRTFIVSDTVNWASASLMKQFGNAANYNVVSGCTVSYSGANLTATVASGTVTLNGSSVAVAGNVVTLVADATNPRYTWIAINSSGVAEIVSGTPAADPTDPDPGDRVEVALVKVAAGATVASSQTAEDRRILSPTSADTNSGSLAADVNAPASTTLADITGLAASVSANTTYQFRGQVGYTSAAAANYKLGVTFPAAGTLIMMLEYFNTSNVATISSITASGGSVSAMGNGASSPGMITFTGILMNGANAGTLQLQHAPVAVSGTTTTKAKSRLEVF